MMIFAHKLYTNPGDPATTDMNIYTHLGIPTENWRGPHELLGMLPNAVSSLL